MEFMSTNLPNMVSYGLFQEHSFDLGEAHIDKMFNILFTGVSNILKDNMNKEQPTVFVINEKDGRPVAFAKVEYFEGENDNPGNWSLVWGFDPEDIPEKCLKLDLGNSLIHSYFKAIAGEKYGIRFTDTSSLVVVLTYCIEQLYKWLDENAKEDSETEIELDGVFKAVVKVVDGKKIFAVIPMGEIKTMIKDDSSIEK